MIWTPLDNQSVKAHRTDRNGKIIVSSEASKLCLQVWRIPFFKPLFLWFWILCIITWFFKIQELQRVEHEKCPAFHPKQMSIRCARCSQRYLMHMQVFKQICANLHLFFSYLHAWQPSLLGFFFSFRYWGHSKWRAKPRPAKKFTFPWWQADREQNWTPWFPIMSVWYRPAAKGMLANGD